MLKTLNKAQQMNRSLRSNNFLGYPTYNEWIEYRKARNRILRTIVGLLIIFGTGVSIVLAGVGFTLAAVILIVLCFLAYVIANVRLGA